MIKLYTIIFGPVAVALSSCLYQRHCLPLKHTLQSGGHWCPKLLPGTQHQRHIVLPSSIQQTVRQIGIPENGQEGDLYFDEKNWLQACLYIYGFHEAHTPWGPSTPFQSVNKVKRTKACKRQTMIETNIFWWYWNGFLECKKSQQVPTLGSPRFHIAWTRQFTSLSPQDRAMAVDDTVFDWSRTVAAAR